MAHSGKTMTFATDLVPQEDNIYNLGYDNQRWKIYGDLQPLATKIYNAPLYNTSSGANFYQNFATVIPVDYNALWIAHYRITITAEGHSDYTEICDVSISGRANTYYTYKIYNSIVTYSIYQHMLLNSNSTSNNQHELGYRMQGSYGADSVAKVVKVELLEQLNCIVTLLDNLKLYTSATPSGYTWRGFNATSNGLQEAGDTNDIGYYILSNGFKGKAGSNKVYRYCLFARTGDGTYESFVMQDNTVATTKTVNPHGFVPDGKIYWNANNTVYSEGTLNLSPYQQYHALDYRYSFNFNNTFLPDYCETYVVYTYNEDDGLLYLDTAQWLAAALPTTADGKIYQRIGSKYYTGTSNYYQGSLLLENPYYEYKDGDIRSWSATHLSNITGADDLKAIEAISGTTGLLKKTAANTWTLDTSDYVTSSGITSVTIGATSPVQSSTSTAQTGSSASTTISLKDAYGDTKNPYGSKTKNYVLAAPSNANGVPSFRALVAADIPNKIQTNWELNAASGNSPALLFTRDGSLTDWKIFVTSGKLSFQSATDGSTWTERGYFKDNSGDFVATSFTGKGSDLTDLDASNISSGTLNLARLGNQNANVVLAGPSSGSAAAPTFRELVAADIPNLNWSKITSGKPTTLSGYGITDAKIASGTITLGSNTISPVTAINWDSTNKKLTRTINGTAADVVTAATLRTDLGLSNALHFIGITSTTLADGSTTATLTAKSTGSLTKTTDFVDGDVVMDGDQLREYVWSGSAWRLLGITTSTEYTQPTSTATNTWIAQVSQGTDGKITATTGSLNTSGTWSGKATTSGTADKIKDLTTTDKASSSNDWRRVWISYANKIEGRPAYTDNLVYQTSSNTLKTPHLLIEHVSGDQAEMHIKYSTTIDYWWGVGTANENHGLYDVKAGKWILSAGSANTWSFVGNADTATTATNLSAAPTIASGGTSTVDLSADTAYTLTVGGKSVIFKTPADNNTATATDDILEGSNSGTAITYKPYTAQQNKLSFDTSTTNPTLTGRLNLNGYLHATKLYSGNNEVLTIQTKSKALSSAGWYRILDCTAYSMAFFITFYGGYNNQPPTPVTFLVSHAYNTTRIEQIGRSGYIGWIQQLRAVHHDTSKFYIDVYYAGSKGNTCAFEITPLDPNARSNITLIDFTAITGSITANASCETTLESHADIADTATSAGKWTTARNISISDSDGTNTGTTVSVDGSAAATLKLPATIKASLIGNADTATTLQNARTLWGQSFDGSANITGNLIDVGNQIRLLSGQTELQFLTSTGGAANGKFGKLGLNTTYANVDFTNYILDVNGKARIGALDGGQHVINGNVQLNAQSGSYNEGLRINRSTTGYANVYLGGTRSSASGNQTGGWWIGTLSTPADATSNGDAITNTVFTISNNNTSDTLSIKGTRGATIGTNSGWAIRPRLAIGTTYNTSYTLYVAGTGYFTNNVNIVTTSTTANTAAYGTLTLGNNANVNSTTAHSEGQIVIYSAATQAHTIKGTSTTTAYTHTLPNDTGLLVSLSGGTAKGSTTKPVYIPNTGIVTECSTYAGGTKVTLNGADKGASTASFYAPTSGGTVGNVLISAGTSAPAWYGGAVMTGTAAADWKTAFNGTTDATASDAAAVTIAGGLGIAKSLIVGEIATVADDVLSPRFTLTVNGTDKAYLQYNTTDDSIDFIFV